MARARRAALPPPPFATAGEGRGGPCRAVASAALPVTAVAPLVASTARALRVGARASAGGWRILPQERGRCWWHLLKTTSSSTPRSARTAAGPAGNGGGFQRPVLPGPGGNPGLRECSQRQIRQGMPMRRARFHRTRVFVAVLPYENMVHARLLYKTKTTKQQKQWERLPTSSGERAVLAHEIEQGCESVAWQARQVTFSLWWRKHDARAANQPPPPFPSPFQIPAGRAG